MSVFVYLYLFLDSAADVVSKSQASFVPDKKERIVSLLPSGSLPPANAPDWALQPEYRKGRKGIHAHKEMNKNACTLICDTFLGYVQCTGNT